ncbi:FAD binding domain protein [Aspergillus rambellii]|uniref:FAD binding domain protein n=3 Tax=Aspergillus subgen. Nidulantes TaxID=2720870 RepID=A0A0F8ULV2_9EURO|nr:FAD binding domain protein [Aspergillus rambellii]KKK15721.1 FAD binding domain protein [Aspergillus ochraceoroseus]
MTALNGTLVVNGTTNTAVPLKILVVGGGIGGLTAAIALRKQGHDVQIFEQSRLATETGAALHLAPNSNGILKRLGVFAEESGANKMERLTEYTATGELDRSLDLTEPNKRWQHQWLLAHRIELHNQLKAIVTNPRDDKDAIPFHTASRVVSVDPVEARVTLEDGRHFQGDLVIGADGVHSVTRSAIPGGNVKVSCCGKSAFRFLVPKEAALEDPETARFVQDPGELCIWYGPDRRIVMYPTSNNTVLNFVVIHPEAESADEAEETWGQSGNLEKMLQIFSAFDPAVLNLLSKADPNSVRVWKLLDMEEIPQWHNERLVLLGDAAHPFLPHQGQGAGVAIEDAASLAVVLPLGTPVEEVPLRLQLYDQIRHQRASRIQEFSRLAGRDRSEETEALDIYGFTNYNFGHDEWDNSTQKLREWTWNRIPKPYWRMPIAFGPMPGPRQTHLGVPRDGSKSTFTTASIKFKTSRTLLQNLFPPDRQGWRFSSPDTIAYASFSQTTLDKMEWLGGSGYKHIGLYIHGVEYVKKDGSVVKGSYLPILFESLTDPIVSGREELGMPKLYTSVDVYRRATSYRIRTGWQGALWGNFLLENLVEVDPSSATGGISGEADEGILAYKYLPKSGRANKNIPAEEYPIFDPFSEAVPTPRPQRMFTTTQASFQIDPLDWEQLPTLHHVISRLAELPVYEIVGAKLVEGEGVPDVSGARPIE